MDLRGEEGESCIAAEESRCNRLTRFIEAKLCKVGLNDGASWLDANERPRLGRGGREGDGGEKKERKRLL